MIKTFENFIKSNEVKINEMHFSDDKRKNLIELKEYIEHIKDGDILDKRALLIFGDYEESLSTLHALGVKEKAIDGDNMTREEFFHHLCMKNNRVLIIRGYNWTDGVISMFKHATSTGEGDDVYLGHSDSDDYISYRGYIIILAEDDGENDFLPPIKSRAEVIDLR